MRISFLDLTRQNPEVEVETGAALARVFARGRYVLGPEVDAFEEEWADFCELKASAAVASGTDALSLALIASGAVRKGAGDEVIVPTLTAPYTALAVLNAGGVPIFADIDPDTYTLAPEQIESAVTSRTRAVVPVHLYGQMADMPGICEVAASRDLIVIEDAAQAHGARYDGRMAGAFGLAAAHSFYPTKNLGGCGDGGAIVSNDRALIDRIKILREGGHERALAGNLEGRNSRLDEIQAALLRVKLKHLAGWNEQRKNLARVYHELLAPSANLRRPSAREEDAHVFHLYVIAHEDREGLQAHLAAHNIQTMIHYPHLLHQRKLFRQAPPPSLPIAEGLVNQIVSLPLYPQLSEAEARTVAQAVAEFSANS